MQIFFPRINNAFIHSFERSSMLDIGMGSECASYYSRRFRGQLPPCCQLLLAGCRCCGVGVRPLERWGCCSSSSFGGRKASCSVLFLCFRITCPLALPSAKRGGALKLAINDINGSTVTSVRLKLKQSDYFWYISAYGDDIISVCRFKG